MRLLHFEDGTFYDGRVTLVEFPRDNIPRYGILSHIWGADDQEVTFKDITEGTGQDKLGYNKIRFCEEKANEELQYFWIDTCCIDKSNNVELQDAINSMFRWYQDAAICYVYLSDVSRLGFPWDCKLWQRSQWFTRGWTLQELLAPKSVEFYSVDGEYLGERKTQVRRIYNATAIPWQALQGRPLSRFSVNERLKWAEWRETTLNEDAAYCLLGIFDVQMPIMYGEGRERALIRLQEHINASQESKGHVKPVVKSISKLIRGDSKPAPALSPPLERIKNFQGKDCRPTPMLGEEEEAQLREIQRNYVSPVQSVFIAPGIFMPVDTGSQTRRHYNGW